MGNVYCFDDIDDKGVDEFVLNNNLFLDRINTEIYKDENFPGMIGGSDNIQVMLENHRNHISFMNIVLRLRKSSLLEKTLPWVYKTYRNQGFSYDYFKTELELWKRAVLSCLEKGEPIAKVYDAMLENHESSIQKSLELERNGNIICLNGVQKDFLDALVEGDSRKVIRYSEDYLENHDIQSYYSELITPSMHALGSLWEDGAISTAHEHLASSIISRILASYNVNMKLPKVTRGSIVISAVANEFHEIGAWMTANAFELAGWNVYYLGANTPLKDILELISNISPHILGLSITMVNNLENLIRLVDIIRSKPEFDSMKIYTGGQIFSHFPEITEIIKADYFATGFEESVNEANRYWSGLNE